jgi:5-methylcytosine-specific restriction endonuclease McrA
MAKTTIQKSAKTKADRLFSQLIRQNGTCEHCRQPQGRVQLQCAHWISRRYAHTRTDFDNAFCLCAGCHRWFTDHPTEFGRWAIGQRSEVTYQRLLEVSQKRSKFDWVAELGRLEAMR